MARGPNSAILNPIRAKPLAPPRRTTRPHRNGIMSSATARSRSEIDVVRPQILSGRRHAEISDN